MNIAGTIAILILALLILAACPPLIYTLADNIERSARFIVRVLRAHADTARVYPRAFRRNYARRAEA